MKFLCLECDRALDYDSRQPPRDGGIVARFACPQCGRGIAMVTNPMEARFVQSLGEEGAVLGPAPETEPGLGGDEASSPSRDAPSPPRWSRPGRERLDKVPRFVRAMVRKIYTDWAAERGIDEITPAVMDAARVDLGLEEM